jgi:hypothetical protein
MLFKIYTNVILKERIRKPHGYICIDSSSQLDAVWFADDLAFLASTEGDLQRPIYEFHLVPSNYNTEMSTGKSKIMAFR